MTTTVDTAPRTFDVALREAFIEEVEFRKETHPGLVHKPLDVAVMHKVLADVWNRYAETEKLVERLAAELAYLRKALGEDKGKK